MVQCLNHMPWGWRRVSAAAGVQQFEMKVDVYRHTEYLGALIAPVIKEVNILGEDTMQKERKN